MVYRGIVLVSLVVLGTVVAVFPFWPKITAGVALLAFGLKLVYDIISDMPKNRGGKAKRQADKHPQDIYSTDFVDKSDKQ